MEQANATPETIDEQDLSGRRDLRDQTIVTIDGADAKDLDDAVTVTKLKNGRQCGRRVYSGRFSAL